MQMASSREELEHLADLFPKWRQSRQSFDKHDSELFVRESSVFTADMSSSHTYLGILIQVVVQNLNALTLPYVYSLITPATASPPNPTKELYT